jgi:hypothetical protein
MIKRMINGHPTHNRMQGKPVADLRSVAGLEAVAHS